MLENENLFHKMFEQHDAIMLLIEPKSGRIVDANNKALAFYGYSKPELMTKTIQEINCLSDKEVAKERNLALKEKEISSLLNINYPIMKFVWLKSIHLPFLSTINNICFQLSMTSPNARSLKYGNKPGQLSQHHYE